jgi:hypothetical protein
MSRSRFNLDFATAAAVLALIVVLPESLHWIAALLAAVGAARSSFSPRRTGIASRGYLLLLATLATIIGLGFLLHSTALLALPIDVEITPLGLNPDGALDGAVTGAANVVLLPLMTIVWLGAARKNIDRRVMGGLVFVALISGFLVVGKDQGIRTGDEDLQAARMISEASIAGWGPGGYSRNLNNFRYRNNDAVSRITSPHRRSTLLVAEIGLVGFVLLMLVYAWPLWSSVKMLSRGVEQRTFCLVGLFFATVTASLALLFGPPGIWTNEFSWLAAAAAGSAVCATTREANPRPVRTGVVIALSVVAVCYAWGAYQTSFGTRGYAAKARQGWAPTGETGLFPYLDSSGQKMRWTGRTARFEVETAGAFFVLPIQVSRLNSEPPEGLLVTIRANGALLEELHYFGATDEELTFRTPGTSSSLVIETEVNRTFEPQHMGLMNGFSQLGVALGEIRFHEKLPDTTPVGTYEWRPSGGVAGWSGAKPMRYRWTRRTAAWGIDTDAAGWCRLFLRAGHPEISQRPVHLQISNQAGLLRELEIGDHEWRQVVLSPAEIRRSKFLSTSVDRTFNPFVSGSGNDRRDLGIAAGELQCFEALPPEGVGFFDWQPISPNDPKGGMFGWAGNEAALALPRSTGEWTTFEIMCPLPDIASNPLNVTITSRDAVLRTFEVADNGWHEILLSPREIAGVDSVRISSDRTWSAIEDLGGTDRRRMSIAVSAPNTRVLTGNEEVGFHRWESASGPDGKPLRFRWTGRAGSTPIAPRPGEWAQFALMTLSPAASERPIEVTITGGGVLLRSLELRSGVWYSVDLSAQELAGLRRIDVSVDRTWTPADDGQSRDRRRLGVAMSEIEYFSRPVGETGLFAREWVPDGFGNRFEFRWTERIAAIEVTHEPGKWAHLDVMSAIPGIAESPVRVLVYGDERLLRSLEIRDNRWNTLWFAPEEIAGASLLTFVVDRTWQPSEFGPSDDSRSLGIAITDLRFREARTDSVWERFFIVDHLSKNTTVVPANVPGSFRWCGRQAVLRNAFNPGDWLMIRADHPDIEERPVRVRIIGDGELLSEEILVDHEVRRVLLRSHELSDAAEVTLEVSRTWTGSRSGLFDDDREIGIAVAIQPPD